MSNKVTLDVFLRLAEQGANPWKGYNINGIEDYSYASELNLHQVLTQGSKTRDCPIGRAYMTTVPLETEDVKDTLTLDIRCSGVESGLYTAKLSSTSEGQLFYWQGPVTSGGVIGFIFSGVPNALETMRVQKLYHKIEDSLYGDQIRSIRGTERTAQAGFKRGREAHRARIINGINRATRWS